MVDVQVEHGFTRIADALYEALIRSPMPGRHKDTVHAIIRLTYGYQKKADRIGSDQLAELLGVKPTGVRRMLRDLHRWGVITRRGGGGGRGDCPMVGVVKDFGRWHIGQSETSTSKEGLRRTPSVKRNAKEESGTPDDQKRNAKRDKGGPRRSTPKRTKEKTENTIARKQKTSAPERLSDEDRTKVQLWALEKEPWAVQRLNEFEEACLDHHISKGTMSTDWKRNLHQWIRNHKQWHGTGVTGGNGQGDPLDARRNPITAAIRNIREGAERAERDNREADAAIPAKAGRGGKPEGVHRGDF